MTQIKLKNLNKIQTQIRKKIIKAARSPDIRQGVADEVVDQIRKEPVPVTKEATIAWRKYLEQRNPTHPDYKLRFINITFTGELLDDLKKSVLTQFSGSKISWVFEHSNRFHKKYKKPNGRTVKGKRKTHKQISEFVIAKGYKYLNFSDKSKSRVLKFVKDNIFRKLK